MPVVGSYEYTEAELIGHGAFALVFKGRRSRVRTPRLPQRGGGGGTCRGAREEAPASAGAGERVVHACMQRVGAHAAALFLCNRAQPLSA